MESRAKNASRNILYGLILRLYQIIVPFLMRTVIIYNLGVAYLGLNSLFVSVLEVLSLTELGVGSAMVYSMYEPIAKHENEKLNALLNLYKIYYRIIGTVIAVLGILLAPFIPRLIKAGVPNNINIYVLYLLNLFGTILTYWLFAYRMSIFQAHQRMDIVSKTGIIIDTVKYLLQVLVIVLLKNYYLYVIISLLMQVIINISVAVLSKKYYPDIIPKGKVDESAKKKIDNRIKDLFTAKIGTIVVGSVDTVVISAFLGLIPLAIYQNYYYIMNAVYGLVLVLFSSVLAGIGNSLITESMDKNYEDMNKFTFLACWLITICICCFAVVYQPFIKVWVGEELMLDYSFVVMFCIYFYVMVLAMVWATVKDAAGLWHQDRFRPLLGALFNLILNVILVNIIGLYGIVLSTVLSYVLVSMPWLIYNIFKFLYKRSMKNYLLRLGKYAVTCIICSIITILICNRIEYDGITAIVINGIVAVLVSNTIQYVIYRKTNEFSRSKELIIKMFNIGVSR